MVEHAAILRGLQLPALAPSDAPQIIARSDANFIENTLDDLVAPNGFAALNAKRVVTRSGETALKLLQPVQRTFNLALLEIVCDRFGEPRLDPQSIDSAGLVVRRVRRVRGARDARLEGWFKSDDEMSWRAFDALQDDDRDPDPQYRRPRTLSGNAYIDRLLNANLDSFAESIAPLFVAPPNVCSAARKTILYGLIPVTSSDRTRVPQANASIDDTLLQAHLPTYLKAGSARSVPRAGATLTASDATADDLAEFLLFLRQLAVEWEALGSSSGAQTLFNTLNQIALTFGNQSQGAGAWLRAAVPILLELRGGSVRMPDQWAAINANLAQQLFNAVRAQLDARAQNLNPDEPRFADPNAQYRLRAFVRVKQDEGCPPALVWSAYSPLFTIAPWYESGDAPPHQVILPDATDPEFLKKLKPNVSFVMPEKLANLLNQNSPKDFLDGKAGPGGGGIGILWICSFSIPLITLCAFIVLNIFLQLLNIVFFWLLYIKICIPIPIPKKT